MRKTVGAIVGFAILLGLLLAVAFYTWPTSARVSEAEYQTLAELGHRLVAVDDLEQRGILSEKIAEAERQHYSVKAQTALSESHFQALVEIKYKISTIEDLQERGILSAEVAKTEKQRYLAEAQPIVGEALGSDQLAILLEHLDNGQPVEAQETAQNGGDFSIPTIIWVVLGFALVIVAGWLIQPYLSSIRERLLSKRKPAHTPDLFPHAAEADKFTPSHIPLFQPQTEPSTPSVTTSLESSDARSPFTESLTKRELEVLALVAKGLTNREIAQKLIITPGTAKVHISNIYSKLCVNRRVQAVAKAQELGILSSER